MMNIDRFFHWARWEDADIEVRKELERRVQKAIDDALTASEAKVSALEEENRRLREALTPSCDTKAEYMGEFKFTEYRGADEEGYDVYEDFVVPWTTIKEIMSAIRAHADLSTQPSEPTGIFVSAEKILAMRDALVASDLNEAYHQLYSVASPNFDKFEPWAEIEAEAEPTRVGPIPDVLPCDVKLPPRTLFRKGVSMAAFLTGLRTRIGRDDHATTFPDRADLSCLAEGNNDQ